MMDIDFKSLPPSDVYHCLTQTLIPRPVAWVLTENPAGDYNLAPFSYFTAVSSDPPLVMISVGKKPDGSFKDTRVNIEARGHFVIHQAHSGLAAPMTETARALEHGDSELDRIELTTTPFAGFSLPRLVQCRVAMACRLFELKEVGTNRQALIFGEVQHLYVDDKALIEDKKGRLKVDAAMLDPVGRLGANEYSKMGEVLTIPRPS
tara:strand:- start:3387 stop:4004 length:618 start_codon:yes stop_codon:yes gene_type:complete